MEYLLRCAMVDTRVLLRGCTRWLVQRRHSAASPEWLVGLLTPHSNHWLCSNTFLPEWLVGLLTPHSNHWLRSHTLLSEWLVGLLTPHSNHWLRSHTLLSEWLVGLLTPLCNHWFCSNTLLSICWSAFSHGSQVTAVTFWNYLVKQ